MIKIFIFYNNTDPVLPSTNLYFPLETDYQPAMSYTDPLLPSTKQCRTVLTQYHKIWKFFPLVKSRVTGKVLQEKDYRKDYQKGFQKDYRKNYQRP